jgi:hydrogenase expression/formation protein HypE
MRPLKIDPLGLIGSGSLLICCRPHATALLLERLDASHIRAARIGTVVEAPPGISAVDGEAAAPWPRFHVDEIARLFA